MATLGGGDASKSLRARIDTLERENRELKRSLYDLSLQHHAVVQEWSKSLPPHAPQLKQLVKIDVSRILSNPLISSIVSTSTAAFMSPPQALTPAHSDTAPLVHSSSSTASLAAMGAAASAASLSSAASGSVQGAAGDQGSMQIDVHTPQPAAGGDALVSPTWAAGSVPAAAIASAATNDAAAAAHAQAMALAKQRDDALLSAVTSALTSASGASEFSSSSSTSSTALKGRSAKALHLKCDLVGHTGAAYALGFAPGAGRFLASGSFDKTVRVWDLWQAQTGGQAEVAALGEHQLPVAALVWHSDAKRLVTGSFDQTVRVNDVEAARSTACFFVSGFVQSVAIHPFENNIMFVGTNNKKIRILDARVPDGIVREMCNKSVIHSTYMFRHGDYIMSADHQGLLKTWDTGTGRAVHEFETDATRSTPISHIAVCEPRESEEEGRLLAANCWDNVLRVYNRGKSLQHFYASASSTHPFATTAAATPTPSTGTALPSSVSRASVFAPYASASASSPSPPPPPPPPLAETARASTPAADGANDAIASSPSSASATTPVAFSAVAPAAPHPPPIVALSPFMLTPIHECRSHRNKSWPIKSSFFLGAEYHGKGSWRPPGMSALLADRHFGASAAAMRGDLDMLDPLAVHASAAASGRPINFAQSVLLATGSSDAFAYVFDVGGPAGTASLVQRLEGHRDRVYAAQFHPHDPILATASADCVVKIWGPRDSFFNA